MINKRYYNTKRKRKARRDAKADIRKDHLDDKPETVLKKDVE